MTKEPKKFKVADYRFIDANFKTMCAAEMADHLGWSIKDVGNYCIASLIKPFDNPRYSRLPREKRIKNRPPDQRKQEIAKVNPPIISTQEQMFRKYGV